MEPRQARTGLSGHVTISVRRLFRKEMRPIREINFFRTLSAFQNDLNPRYQTSWYIIHPSTATYKPAYSAYGNSLVCPRGLKNKTRNQAVYLTCTAQCIAVQCSASWCMELDPFPPSLSHQPSSQRASRSFMFVSSCPGTTLSEELDK